MDKIVILTGHSEGYEKLKALFTMLFPECEIQIISMQPEGLGNVPEAPKLTTDDK